MLRKACPQSSPEVKSTVEGSAKQGFLTPLIYTRSRHGRYIGPFDQLREGRIPGRWLDAPSRNSGVGVRWQSLLAQRHFRGLGPSGKRRTGEIWCRDRK